MSVATISRESSAAPQTGRAARLATRSGAVQGGRPRAWRRATCRAISPSCRRRWRATSCASASSTRSPARCSRPPRRATRGCRSLGDDLDIRTDLPRYRVFRTASWSTSRPTSRGHWRDDLVDVRARLLVLVRGGAARGRHRAAPHHLQRHRADVPHLDRDARPAGPFHGPMVVSMRPHEAGGRHPRHPDHHALSRRARRAGAYRQAGADRHHRPR